MSSITYERKYERNGEIYKVAVVKHRMMTMAGVVEIKRKPSLDELRAENLRLSEAKLSGRCFSLQSDWAYHVDLMRSLADDPEALANYARAVSGLPMMDEGAK